MNEYNLLYFDALLCLILYIFSIRFRVSMSVVVVAATKINDRTNMSQKVMMVGIEKLKYIKKEENVYHHIINLFLM